MRISSRTALALVSSALPLVTTSCFPPPPPFGAVGWGQDSSDSLPGKHADTATKTYFNVQSSAQLTTAPILFDGPAKPTVANVPATTGIIPTIDAPGFAAANVVDKRITFTGSGMYTSGYGSLRREIRGEYDARITLAVASLKGIMDSATAGRFQIDFDPVNTGSNAAHYHLLRADWNESVNGFRIVASSSETPGTSLVNLGDTREVELRLAQDATQFSFYYRPRPAVIADETGWVLLRQFASTPPSADPVYLGFGADYVMKGGKLYFDFARLDGGESGTAPSAEWSIVNDLDTASDDLDLAHDAALDAQMALSVAGAQVQGARESLLGAVDSLASAETQQTLQPTTMTAYAKKNINAAVAFCDKALAAIAKPKPPARAALAKIIDQARAAAQLAIANMNGYKTTSLKKINGAFVDLVPPI